MTIDFRPPEEQGHAPEATGAAPAAATPMARHLVLRLIRLAGLTCIALGVAALVLEPTFLGEGLALYVGIALVVTGVFDFVAAGVLDVVWRRLQARDGTSNSG